jgi:hypothetical protein
MTTPASPPASRPFSLPAEIAGWYGTAAILAAYAANSFGWLVNTDAAYQLLNLTGALGVAWVCWHKRTWQAFWLESIWAAIAVVALVRSFAGGS